MKEFQSQVGESMLSLWSRAPGGNSVSLMPGAAPRSSRLPAPRRRGRRPWTAKIRDFLELALARSPEMKIGPGRQDRRFLNEIVPSSIKRVAGVSEANIRRPAGLRVATEGNLRRRSLRGTGGRRAPRRRSPSRGFLQSHALRIPGRSHQVQGSIQTSDH
jgi:hypothetical protein